ncbi:MAG: branched-chain amino acid ABC transporter permease [Desulfobacterales bacterium]|nr:MAG: branched-chain amino acid ABC transporter permease [Desulfobacterales bacterium]
MKSMGQKSVFYGVIVILSLIVPWLLPAYQTQLAFLWVMVVFALTWDVVGGQMGYNSFGNIVFFGIGMYVTAVIQRNMHFDIEEYVHVAGRVETLTPVQYLEGLFLGMGAGVVVAVVIAAGLGACILAMGMRGQYFGICTLGLGVAAGELANGWEYIGAGSGLVTPVFPDQLGQRGAFFYYIFFILAVIAFLTLRYLYAGRFGLAINAIRDDEDKAEAMGIHTTRYKIIAWCISAFFLSLVGGGAGHLIGFIDPTEVAFAGATFGVWMILMAILGGKGTLWGPVIGAVIFHITQELFWTYLFGWQRVALGALIVAIVVFFPMGIMGWMRERWPERFGHRVEEREAFSASKGGG